KPFLINLFQNINVFIMLMVVHDDQRYFVHVGRRLMQQNKATSLPKIRALTLMFFCSWLVKKSPLLASTPLREMSLVNFKRPGGTTGQISEQRIRIPR